MTNEYNNACGAADAQFCGVFDSNNKATTNCITGRKPCGGGSSSGKQKKKMNQILSLLLILLIFSSPQTTVRITAVELRDAREFSRSDPAGPVLD